MQYSFDTFPPRHTTESAKWRHYPADVLPMWVADMDFVSPEPVVRALQERVAHGVFGYPDEPRQLREVIAARMAELYSWKIDPDAVVLLPGVIVGFNLACHTVAEPGAAALFQTPVYFPILTAPATARMQAQEMPLTLRQDGSYAIDFDSFEAAITSQTRLFILCNPHNPVGRVFRREELSRLAEICLRHGVTICSDEIHCDLVYRGHQHLPIAALDPEVARHTITLMAPSKTYNIAGLKCSFAIIPDEELRRRYRLAKQGLVGEVNLLGLTAALAAYQAGQEWLEQVLAYLQSNRDFLSEFIEREMPAFRVRRSEGTYLAWLDCREAGLHQTPYQFFLEKARVAASDGASFGRGGDGFLRLNYACPRSLLQQALAQMAQALRDHAHSI